MTNYDRLPEDQRPYAKLVADLENRITNEAEYLMESSVRRPEINSRVAKRTAELAEFRSLILKFRPAITRGVLTDVHSVLDTYPKPNW